MHPTKFTIYGERCSGTNYLQELIQKNFDLELVWDYEWKHWFGFSHPDEAGKEACLFLGIVRNPYQWIGSLHQQPHHVCEDLRNCSLEKFITTEWYSYIDHRHPPIDKAEQMKDRHIYTGERYKNLLELRNVKNRYLLDDLPQRVKHYYLISYDKLIEDPFSILEQLKLEFGLKMRSDKFEKVTNDSKYKRPKFIKKEYHLQPKIIQLINQGLDWQYEARLGFHKME